MVKQNFW